MDINSYELINDIKLSPISEKHRKDISHSKNIKEKKWKSLLSMKSPSESYAYQNDNRLRKNYSNGGSIISTIYRGSNGNKFSYSRREVKKAQKLFVIVLFFMFCWLPLYTSNTIMAFCQKSYCKPSDNLMDILIILSHINSAGSPFLYAFQMKDFRNTLKRMIFKGAINKQKIRELRREELFNGTSRCTRQSTIDGTLRPAVSDFYLYRKRRSSKSKSTERVYRKSHNQHC